MSEHDGRGAGKQRRTRRRVNEKWRVVRPQIPLRPFIDYAWDDYDPKAVTSYLLNAQPTFYRHTSILHEGFCAWVICPGRRKLYQDAMVYRIAKAVEDAEAPWRQAANAFNHSVGETIGRILRADRRFFEEVYYPAGGPMRILRALSRPALKRCLLSHATKMLEAVHLLALHHYHLTHLRDKKTYHIPSKDAGAALIKTAFGAPVSHLFVEGLRVKDTVTSPANRAADGKAPMQYKLRGETNIIASWNAARVSVAYAYAAASLPTEPGRTLLHEIVACRSTYAKHRALMPEWCGRARFVVEGILNQCHPEQKPYDYGAEVLNVDPIPFELPSLFPFAPDVIARGYKNVRANLQERQAEQKTSHQKHYSGLT